MVKDRPLTAVLHKIHRHTHTDIHTDRHTATVTQSGRTNTASTKQEDTDKRPNALDACFGLEPLDEVVDLNTAAVRLQRDKLLRQVFDDGLGNGL